MPERRWRAATGRRAPHRSPRSTGSTTRHPPSSADQPRPGDAPPPQITAPQADLVIKRVTLAGSLGAVLIVNRGTTPIALSNSHLCQAADAFPLNAAVLKPGEQLRIHLGVGDNTPNDWYAAGRLGELSNDGELALYNDGSIGVPSAMVAYVAWGRGGPARPVAQAARLWTDTNLDAVRGDTIALTGSATGAHGYLVHRRDARVTKHRDSGVGSRSANPPSAPEGRAPW